MHYEVRVMLRPGGLLTSYFYNNPNPYDYKKIFTFKKLKAALDAREVLQRMIQHQLWEEDFKWVKKNIITEDYPVRIDNMIYEVVD